MGKSIRIKTTPGGGDKYVSLNVEQDFDFLEVLSVKIRQEDVYRRFCADYGVVVGRVILNDGFGAPNAKVSVFIPLSEEDEDNTLITSIYPFKTVTDQDSSFIRYNLLPDSVQNGFHKPVGTFPSKRKILNNDVYLDVYDKYYKFTTTTNSAGDFMLFGVPVGQQTIHFDLDLSDMGDVSLSPADLIAGGVDEGEFTSITENNITVYGFKNNNNLDILPQIKSTNIDVSVQPFWGDTEQCQVGITRLDWQVEGTVIPSAIFFGSVLSEDGDKNHVTRDCAGISTLFNTFMMNNLRGVQSQMLEDGLGGVIGVNRVENGKSTFFNQQLIDSLGRWAFTLPMYKGRVITNENGDLVPSGDESGIPTYGDYRFEFRLNREDISKGTKNGLGRILAPNYLNGIGGYAIGINPATHSLNAPMDLSSGVINADDVQSTNTTGYYLGYFHNRGYDFYYRFKAGSIYTILQNWNIMNESVQNPVFQLTNDGGTDKVEIPANSVYGAGVYNGISYFDSEVGAKTVGCLYFPKFKIGSDMEHCENLVWGSFKNSGSNDRNKVGGSKSLGPYYYLQSKPGTTLSTNSFFKSTHGSLGRTDIKELTIEHNFFTDGFATLQNGLSVPPISGQIPIPDTSADLDCSGDEKYKIGSTCYYIYFGLIDGETSLDLAKEKYNI